MVDKRSESSLKWEEEIEAEFLPLLNVMSIVRSCIPKDPIDFGETAIGIKMSRRKKSKIGKSFQVLMQQCVGEFIQIIATQLYQRLCKSLSVGITFTDEDILSSMESLQINQYSTTLRLFMNDYRELVYEVFKKRLETLVEPLGLPSTNDGDETFSANNSRKDFERELLALMNQNENRKSRDA
jgi:hypothetical protein